MKTYEEERKSFEEEGAKFADSAFPTKIKFSYGSKINTFYTSASKGMSKREYFALFILNGMIASGLLSKEKSPLEISLIAVDNADALIKALNEGVEE